MDYSLSPSRPRHCSRKNNLDPAQQPWTATRCHRLLRPLLTHIAALRKCKARRSAVSSGRTSAPEEVTSTSRKRRSSVDPASSSYYPEKRVCRKYTSRGSRASAASHAATTPQKPAQTQRRRVLNSKPASSRQEVVLPTPFLRRVKNHPLSSSPARGPADDDDELSEAAPSPTRGPASKCSHPRTCLKRKCVFETKLASLRPSTDRDRYPLYKSTYQALDALLRATSQSKYPSPAAPKSLLAMCLRKVPDYVAELEHWDRKDAEQGGTKSDKQLSFEVYSELEDLDGVSEGWRHLCAVVRAHGVRVIREAIVEEQLFDDAVAELMVRLCLEYMPAVECMGLVDGYIQRQYPKPFTAEDSLFATPGLQPLRILTMCNAAERGTSILPAKLAELLSQDLLPGKWILTKEFKALWVSTAGLIVEKQHRQDVIDFIIATFSQMCDLVSNSERLAGRMRDNEQPWDKAQNTLTGAIAALTSITLLLQDGASSSRRIGTVNRRVKFVIDSCSRDSDPKHIGTYLLSLCAYLAFKTESSLKVIQTAWGRVGGRSKGRGSEEWTRQYDATTVLVSSVAYYCSRGAQHTSPSDHFARLCDELETLQVPGNPFGSLRVDGAFCLAEQTGDLRDLAFAEGLKGQNTGEDGGAAALTKQTRGGGGHDETSFVGFKWDEGISEWVNASPVLPTAKRTMRGLPRLSDGRGVFLRQRKSVDYVEEDVDEAASATSDTEDYESSAADESELAASDFEDAEGEEDERGEGQEEAVEEENQALADEEIADTDDELLQSNDPSPGPEEEIADTGDDEAPDEPSPEPQEDSPTALMPDNGQSESESETPLPTPKDLFAPDRLRRPKKPQPQSPPASSPPFPQRRSIWAPSTHNDDELCLDSPKVNTNTSHLLSYNPLSPRWGSKASRKRHSHKTTTKAIDTKNKKNIQPKRRKSLGGGSLLSLQPRRGKGMMGSSLSSCPTTTATRPAAAAVRDLFRRSTGTTTTTTTATPTTGRRGLFGQRCQSGLDDDSDLDELGF